MWRPSVLQLISSIAFAWIGVGVVLTLVGIFRGVVPDLVAVVAVVIMLGFAGRAPFVGVRVDGSLLVRQSWYGVRRYHPVEAITRVAVGPYSGSMAPWNRWGPTPSAAVTIMLEDARIVEVSELYG